MKTTRHIYNPADNSFSPDTPKLRREIFQWNQEWTGQSEFDEGAETYAEYEVDDVSDYIDEDDMNDTDKAFPYLVFWEKPHRPSSDVERTDIARFAEKLEAKSFASMCNHSRESAWIADDSNFAALDLPEGVTVDLCTPQQGGYPHSRRLEYEITFPEAVTEDDDGDPTDTITGRIHYQVRDWRNGDVPADKLAQAIAAELAEAFKDSSSV